MLHAWPRSIVDKEALLLTKVLTELVLTVMNAESWDAGKQTVEARGLEGLGGRLPESLSLSLLACKRRKYKMQNLNFLLRGSFHDHTYVWGSWFSNRHVAHCVNWTGWPASQGDLPVCFPSSRLQRYTTIHGIHVGSGDQTKVLMLAWQYFIDWTISTPTPPPSHKSK